MNERLRRARNSLEGLSVGDAFGEKFFGGPVKVHMIEHREVPEGTWRVTDDTWMALSIYERLARDGAIERRLLAASFAERYDVSRGYGRGMHQLLGMMRAGVPHQVAITELFDGRGS
jgi:ADP-ribosylglycohydrolase